MKNTMFFKRITVSALAAAAALASVFCLLTACGSETQTDKPGTKSKTSLKLEDGTVVEPYFAVYYAAKSFEDPELEAKRLAAKNSFANKNGIEVTEDEIREYKEKAYWIFDIYRSDKGESNEEVCKREFGISLDEYDTIVVIDLKTEKLYEKLFEEYAAADDEIEAYIREYLKDSRLYLRAVFNGKYVPALPEGMTVEGYPEEGSETEDLGGLIEKIAAAVKSSEDMLELISLNGMSSDEYIITLADLDENVAEAVSKAENGGETVFVKAQNSFMLFYPIDSAEETDPDEISAIKEQITNDKAEKAIEEYISALLR